MPDPERLSARAPVRAGGAVGPLRAPVWVLEDADGDASDQAVGIAERLGLPFRRVPLRWNWFSEAAPLGGASLLGLAGEAVTRRLNPPPGPLRPLLVLSAGRRAAPVSLWMKAALGCHAVHCGDPGPAAAVGRWLWRGEAPPRHDLLVLADRGGGGQLREDVLPVLGAPHRVGPPALRRAAEQWGERLDHLPRPRVGLLVGGRSFGGEMEPARAHALGRSVARLVGGLGGSVLASTTERTGREAASALAAGLGHAMHLIHRSDEPGENPYVGFLALADAVIVTADASAMLSEACATEVPVFMACPELAGPRQRRLLRRLMEAGHVRPLRGDVSPWPRTPLDEAGRVAGEIRRRVALPEAAAR